MEHLRETWTRASGFYYYLRFNSPYTHWEQSTRASRRHSPFLSWYIIRETVTSTTTNPFHADLLYHQILSKIPPLSLPTAMRVFGLYLLIPVQDLTVCDIRNFLVSTRDHFIRRSCPSRLFFTFQTSTKPQRAAIRFYHAFLRIPHRSGPFALDLPRRSLTLPLRWQNFFCNDNCELKGLKKYTLLTQRIFTHTFGRRTALP